MCLSLGLNLIKKKQLTEYFTLLALNEMINSERQIFKGRLIPKLQPFFCIGYKTGFNPRKL